MVTPTSTTDFARAATRDRIVAASSTLFRQRGYAGTGLKAIVAASGAAYGSLYHFFPGGKEELGVESLRLGGDVYLELVEAIFTPDADVVQATRDFFDGAALVVEASDYADACPIATVALEVASTSEPLRQVAADAFESWMAVTDDRFAAAGMEEERAHQVSVELFCLIEGAFLLARTTRDASCIRVVGRSAAATVTDALGH